MWSMRACIGFMYEVHPFLCCSESPVNESCYDLLLQPTMAKQNAFLVCGGDLPPFRVSTRGETRVFVFVEDADDAAV